MISGLESALSQLRNFFPTRSFARVSESRSSCRCLRRLRLRLTATFLAILIGLLVSLYVGARLPGARVLYALLASVRALPDLTLAIFCVIVLGLGTAAGVAALTIFLLSCNGQDLCRSVRVR